MELPLKQSALLSQINSALAHAFPAGSRVNDMGDMHRQIGFVVAPFLPEGLTAVTFHIMSEGNGLYGANLFDLDITGFARDKRTSYGSKGKFKSPPTFKALYECDTVDEAIFQATQKLRKDQLTKAKESRDKMKYELAEQEVAIQALEFLIHKEYREFIAKQK